MGVLSNWLGSGRTGRVIPKLRHVLSCRGRLLVSLCNTVSVFVHLAHRYSAGHLTLYNSRQHVSEAIISSTSMVEAEYNYSSTGPMMTRVDPWIPSPLLPHLNSLRTPTKFTCPPTNMISDDPFHLYWSQCIYIFILSNRHN